MAQLPARVHRFRAMSEVDEVCLTGNKLPGRLADLRKPPKELFLRGELPRGPAVAMVGTRHSTPEYEAYARKLAAQLAAAGVAVLSGGAEGIDTCAHQGALNAGGVTVVVAPAGFNRPFPEKNAKLFQEVLDRGGAYLSLREANIPADPPIFFLRNAVLMALAHVAVVIESPFRSGARNAAAHARRLGRPLFVVTAPPWHTNGHGCLHELKFGARPLLSVKDLLRALSDQNLHAVTLPEQAQPEPRPQQESLDFSATSPPASARSAVLHAVRSGAGSGDEIGLATGLPTGRVSELILTLRLEGVLVTDPSGRFEIDKRLI